MALNLYHEKNPKAKTTTELCKLLNKKGKLYTCVGQAQKIREQYDEK